MSHRLQVLVPEDLNTRIQTAAKRDRVSKGEWVRRAIERALREGQTGGEGRDPLARLASLEAPTGDIEQLLAEIDRGRR